MHLLTCEVVCYVALRSRPTVISEFGDFLELKTGHEEAIQVVSRHPSEAVLRACSCLLENIVWLRVCLKLLHHPPTCQHANMPTYVEVEVESCWKNRNRKLMSSRCRFSLKSKISLLERRDLSLFLHEISALPDLRGYAAMSRFMV